MRREREINLYSLWLIFSLVIVFFGFLIRLNNLGHDSFWFDEILTMRGSNSSLSNAWDAAQFHPPLLYVLNFFIVKTLGENEFILRLLSLFAGTLGIALLLQLGKSLRQAWVGLFASVLLAFSPYHLHYSQDARHYALLMATSLLSYIFLIWAFKQSRWRYWFFYGLAVTVSLYTHYGALLVLATQAMMIVIWGVVQVRNGRFHQLLFPLISAGIVLLLYIPMFSKLSVTLNLNVGDNAVLDTGAAASLTAWVKTALRAFNLPNQIIFNVVIGLAIMGLLIWLWRRQWFPVAFTLTALCLPFVLIQLFGVGRGDNARYIIYTYPFYLLLVAVLPKTILFLIYKRWGTLSFVGVGIGMCLAIAFFSWSYLEAEYAHMQENWRDISAYLTDSNDKPDILLGVSLSFTNGFNSVTMSLPYYLAQTDTDYILLDGGQLTPKEIKTLPQKNAKIQTVVSNWHSSMPPSTEAVTVKEFQSFLYVLQNLQSDGETVDELIALYDQLIPLAKEPNPRCLLHQDLAALYAVDEDFWSAYQEWQNMIALCPVPVDSGLNVIRSQVLQAIVDGLVVELEQTPDEAKAYEIANFVLAYDSKHEGALDLITFVNLKELFETDQALVVQDQAPKLPEIRTFMMPQSGDSREVIFAHPTTAVSFPLQLPAVPVALHTALGLDPQSWGWGGDGVTFVVSIETPNEEPTELFRQHLDNDEIGHNWQDITVALDDYLDQDVLITLSTEPGAADDSTGDWAGWASPRILWEMPNPP